VVEDPQIERGGCRLETPSTEIDATLETRWRRVIASLGRDDPWIEITV
jgi:flagellar assembly protein FliH